MLTQQTEHTYLIAQMTNAESALLFSAADWCDYLGTQRAANRAFGAQLQQEWQPFSVPSALCQTVLDRVQLHLMGSGLAWQNLWAHTLRVIGNALRLADEATISDEQAFLLATLHDIGKLDEVKTGASHALIGALAARQLLYRHAPKFASNVIERIADAIAKKSLQRDPFRRLLHDADKLDKIGATGILRRLSSDAGKHSPAAALRYVADDLADFPSMYHAAAQQLADLKRGFTKQFLGQVAPLIARRG